MTVACRVCGAAHAACGPATTVIGVDMTQLMEAPTVGPLKPYRVVVAGNATVLNLTEAEATRLGAQPIDPTPAPAPSSPTDLPVPDGKGRSSVANKNRRAQP
jgi:hypothetical protein